MTSCPAPFPSRKVLHPLRTSPDRMTVPVKSPEIRGLLLGEPLNPKTPVWKVGRPANRLAPSPAVSTSNNLPGKPAWPLGGDSVEVVPAPIPLSSREPATVLRQRPEGLRQTQCRSRLACALRYGAHLVGRIVAGQGLLPNSQGCPRNFSVTHRFGRFIHRSYTAIPTVPFLFGTR